MPLDTDHLRALIVARYGTLSEAARQLGMHQQHISRLLGGRDLRISDLDEWAARLKCSPRKLIRE